MVHKQELSSINKPKTLKVSECVVKTKCFKEVAVQLKQKLLVLFRRPWKKILAFLCCIVVVEVVLQQEYLRSNDIDKFIGKPNSNAANMEKLRASPTKAVSIEKQASKPSHIVNIETLPTKPSNIVNIKNVVLKSSNDVNVQKPKPKTNSDVHIEKLPTKPRNDKNIAKLLPKANREKESEKLKSSNLKNITEDEKISPKYSESYTAPVSKRFSESLRDPSKPLVYLASVNCGDRLDEGLTMLKTAIFFGKEANLYFIIFTDKQNLKPLTKHLVELAKVASRMKINLEYELYLIYTKPEDGDIWNNMFAPCATQRLFFPLTLPHIDRLMYLDTDTLFLSSVTDLWEEFEIMKPSQLAALVANHEPPGDGWYNRRSLLPYYGPRGLNSGIMLMNLDAMRSFGFTDKMISINSAYRGKLSFPDQDMLNILFADQPSLLHEIGCEFNFRVQHCICDYPESGPCGCKRAEENGISIFHGNRKAFHGIRTKQFHRKRLDFSNILYNSFNKLDVSNSSPQNLLDMLKLKHQKLNPNFACANLNMSLFTKFQQYVEMS